MISKLIYVFLRCWDNITIFNYSFYVQSTELHRLMLRINIITRKAQYTINNDRIIIKVKNLKINCAFIFNFNNKSL